jgi:hypothetical protein
MEIDSEVWIKNKESKKNANDSFWSHGKIVSKVEIDYILISMFSALSLHKFTTCFCLLKLLGR